MYPRNAASPPRIAVGTVVQISDGAVQTSGCTVRVIEQGGAEGDGGGTTAYSTDGVVLYTPTQAETDQSAFVLIAKKTGCIPVGMTVVTTASATAGYAGLDWAAITAPTSTVGLTNTTVGTVTATTTATNVTTVNGLAANVITAASIATDAIDGDAIAASAVTEIQSGLSTLDAAGVRTAVGLASANLDTQLNAIPTASETADQVWDEVLSGHLTAGSTGNALNSAGSAGDPWGTALPGAYGAGTAGKIIGDNVNATISSRASQASLDTVDDFLDTEIAAIKAKTDNLPADPADASDVAAAIAALNDLDAAGVRTAVGLASANLDTQLAALPTAGEAADAVWDEARSGHTTLGTFGESYAAIEAGSCITGTLSTTAATTDLTEATNDHYIGRTIVWITGVLTRQASAITDYDGATKTLTYAAVTEAPSNGDRFVLV